MTLKPSVITVLFGAVFLSSMAAAKEAPEWNPETRWQEQLSAIKVTQHGKTKEYSFVSLIRADGYLCTGSAKAYKALQDGLPLLFGNALPETGDFTITYPAAAECTAKVFTHFLGGAATAEKYLQGDLDLPRQTIVISRLSTKKQVRITYEQVTGKAGEGGDKILHMTGGSGMTISQQPL